MRERLDEAPATMSDHVKEHDIEWKTKNSEGWTANMPDEYIDHEKADDEEEEDDDSSDEKKKDSKKDEKKKDEKKKDDKKKGDSNKGKKKAL